MWSPKLSFGSLTASLGGLGFYTYIHPQLTARILICSGLGAAYAAATAAMLFRYSDAGHDPRRDRRHSKPNLADYAKALGWFQAFTAAEHLIRCGLTVLSPPRELVHIDRFQAAFSYVNMTANVAAVCGTVWLAMAAHRRELQIMATCLLLNFLSRKVRM